MSNKGYRLRNDFKNMSARDDNTTLSDLPDLIADDDLLEHGTCDYESHMLRSTYLDSHTNDAPLAGSIKKTEHLLGLSDPKTTGGVIPSHPLSKSRLYNSAVRPQTYSELTRKNDLLANDIARLNTELLRNQEYIRYIADNHEKKEKAYVAEIERLKLKLPREGLDVDSVFPEQAELAHLKRNIMYKLEAMSQNRKTDLTIHESMVRTEYLAKIAQMESNLDALRSANETLSQQKSTMGISKTALAELLFLRLENTRLTQIIAAKDSTIFDMKCNLESNAKELADIRLQLAMSQRDFNQMTNKIDLLTTMTAIEREFGWLDDFKDIACTAVVTDTTLSQNTNSPTFKQPSLQKASTLELSLGGSDKTYNMVSKALPSKKGDEVKLLINENKRLRQALRVTIANARSLQQERQRIIHSPVPVRDLVVRTLRDITDELSELTNNCIPLGYEKKLDVQGQYNFSGLSMTERNAFCMKLMDQRDLLQETAKALLVEESLLLIGKKAAVQVFTDNDAT